VSVTDVAIEKIRGMIVAGELRPGDRLPREADLAQFVDNDIAFHGGIAVASGNPVIAKLLDSVSGPTVRARIWRGITEGGAIDRTIAEHRSIYEALEHRRPELAQAWMTVHLASVEAWLQSAMP
jgi:GntR family transcriptional regulator, transcriptional repressor for pyruvate dehydrogenase complex